MTDLGDTYLVGLLLLALSDDDLTRVLRFCDHSEAPGAQDARLSLIQEIEFRRTTRANVLATVAIADDPED